MKILVVATIGRTVDAFLRPQLTELRSRGHTVHVLCADPAPLSDLEEATVHEAPWQRPIRPAGVLPAILRTRRMVAEIDPDVVYVHTTIAAMVTRIAVRRHRRRPAVVYCAHGFAGAAAQPRARRWAARAAERVLAPRTDLLFVMNDEDERWARRAPFARVRRVPSIGLDLDAYAERGTGRTAASLLTIAELIPRKRVDLAVRAVAELPEQFALTILGDGPLGPSLEELAASLGVAHRVHLAGQVADVRPYLGSAWLLVTTSRQEGLQRSLLEAMASGLPAVGFDARGVTDLLREVGTVVPGADPSRLAAAVARLADDPVAWADARDAGLRAVRAHDAGDVAARMIAEMESLVRDAR